MKKIEFLNNEMEIDFISITDKIKSGDYIDPYYQTKMYSIYNFFTKEGIENHGCSTCSLKIKRFLLALRSSYDILKLN